MDTAPQKSAQTSPRSRIHKPSTTAWGNRYSSYTKASLDVSKSSHHRSSQERDHLPQRPLSASVASTMNQRVQTSLRPHSSRSTRPPSASRARYLQLETVAFPMEKSALQPTIGNLEASFSPSFTSEDMEGMDETNARAMQLKLEALLEMWSDEHRDFRSSALYCEIVFKQAKALVGTLQRPNAFLSAVAFACLSQVGTNLDKQYPFLTDIIEEIGTSVFSNFTDLQHQVLVQNKVPHHLSLYFEHGKPWFHQVLVEKTRCKSYLASANASKHEIQRLTEQLQEAQAISSSTFVAKVAMQQEAERHEIVDEYFIPSIPQLADLGVESRNDEILKAFTIISETEASNLLTLLLEKASSRNLPNLSDVLATSVSELNEQDQRRFLRECFDMATLNDLCELSHDQAPVHTLVNELNQLLQPGGAASGRGHAKDEAHPAAINAKAVDIVEKIHELVDLMKDVATEIACFQPHHQALFPNDLLQRLQVFECPEKKQRAKKLELDVLTRQDQQARGDKPQCICVCGLHRLFEPPDDVQKDQFDDLIDPIDVDKLDPATKKKRKKSRRRSSVLKRPGSTAVAAGRRKTAVSFQLSRRKSSVSIHVFALSEVCHLLTAILQLQFSRDAASSGERRDLSALLLEDRFECLRPDAKARTCKALAKDYLVRKYGIKSISVMYTMQLERSLVHFQGKEKHIRCKLFRWFWGADPDPARIHSKDYAFGFFQKLVKGIVNLCVAKKPRVNSIGTSPSLTYSTLISMWAEYIGDGDPLNPRTLSASFALEVSKQVFPLFMQQHPHFERLREKLGRASFELKVLELEEFLDDAMTAWQGAFDAQMHDIVTSIESVGPLDPNGFTRCLSLNGFEFTTGERYELFDLLTQDRDENVISSRKMAQLILEAKYLQR